MNGIETAVEFVAQNERIAAAVAAALAAFILYGVAGKRLLGADARFWLTLRRWALPKLDAIGSDAGLYAEGVSTIEEYVGTMYVDDLEDAERALDDMGYLRNPPAALKRSPDGRVSNGSWARRYGHIDGAGRILHELADAPDLVPGTGWVERILGNLLVGVSDILALRQRHVTLFVRRWTDSKVAVDVFVHDEPNSINPLTAWKHYRRGQQSEGDLGGVWDAQEGVQGFRDDIMAFDADFAWSNDGIEQDGADVV